MSLLRSVSTLDHGLLESSPAAEKRAGATQSRYLCYCLGMRNLLRACVCVSCRTGGERNSVLERESENLRSQLASANIRIKVRDWFCWFLGFCNRGFRLGFDSRICMSCTSVVYIGASVQGMHTGFWIGMSF